MSPTTRSVLLGVAAKFNEVPAEIDPGAGTTLVPPFTS